MMLLDGRLQLLQAALAAAIRIGLKQLWPYFMDVITQQHHLVGSEG